MAVWWLRSYWFDIIFIELKKGVVAWLNIWAAWEDCGLQSTLYLVAARGIGLTALVDFVGMGYCVQWWQVETIKIHHWKARHTWPYTHHNCTWVFFATPKIWLHSTSILRSNTLLQDYSIEYTLPICWLNLQHFNQDNVGQNVVCWFQLKQFKPRSGHTK